METKIKNFKLRPAVKEDVKLLFEWVNEKGVRENSLHTELITWKTHTQWFAGKMNSLDVSRIFIAEFDGEPVGQIRFDRDAKTVTIAFSLDKNFRGCGFGKTILREGLAEIRKIWKTPGNYVGIVKKVNISSKKIFEAQKFKLVKKDSNFQFVKKY